MKAKTTNQLLNYTQRQLEKLTDKELRQAVSTLRSTSRKRYERIVESEVYSQSATALWKSSGGGDIFLTIRGMDRTSLYNEYKKYTKFIKSKTSTVKGARTAERSAKNLVEDLSGRRDFSDAEITEIYEMADALKTDTINTIMSSTDRISAVSEVYEPNLSKTEIMERARKRMQEQYESENPTEPLAIYPSRSIK